MKNIVVLGGGGYIGSELTAALVGETNEYLPLYNVKVIDRFYFGKNKLENLSKHNNLQLIQKDILQLKPEDFKDVDVVFDLAGISNDPACDLDERLTWNINFDGCKIAAQSAKKAGVKHYIYGSSCSVYGDTKNDLANEKSLLAPISLYAKVKAHCEDMLLGLGNKDFPVTIVRNATVYGQSRRMRFDLLVNLMCLHAVKQKQIFVLGGGQQWRPLIHILDVVKIFLFLMKNKESCTNEIYNTCANNVQPIEIAKIVAEKVMHLHQVEIVQPPDDLDKRNYRVDSTKLQKLCNNKITYCPLNYGIESLITDIPNISNDISTNTVGYYKHLIATEKFIKELSIDGKLFQC